MILCSDYNPDECPIECLYASNTERYMTEHFDDFFTKSKLYGTDACLLSRKRTTSTKELLDDVTNELKKAQDDVIKKILDAFGFDFEYVKQHKEEFKLEELIYHQSSEHTKNYILSHNGKQIGEWSVRIQVDYDDNTLKSKIYYTILKGEHNNGKT